MLKLEPRLLAVIYHTSAAKDGVIQGIKENAPWLIAIAAILVGVFQNIIRQWLTAAANAVGTAAYERLAASRLLRRVAVRRYLESLRQKYMTINVLFRPNDPLNLKDIYVPLEFLSALEDRPLAGVDTEKLIAARQRIVVLGAPGAGKSVLLRHIVIQHTSIGGRRAPSLVPALLDLHRLTATDDPDIALKKQLADYFARNSFPKAKGFIDLSLKDGSLLLLFDGLDEVPSAQRSAIAGMIDDFLELYPRCPVIVTCRSAAFRDHYLMQASVRLVVADFTDQLIQQFLSRWPGISGLQAVSECVRILNDSPRMLALARNPLLLTMLAYLYTDVYAESSRLLPRSRADFYKDATDMLLRRWHEERNRFDPNSKREVLRRLSLRGLDRGRGTSDRLALEYDLVQSETKDVLHDVGRSSEDADPLLREIIERSGLLLEIDGGERFQFAHLTLQEYFAATELTGSQDDLLERYDRDHDTWRETVRLWCGLTGDCTPVVDRIFAIEPILALECIADASRIDQSTVDKIVDYFMQRPELSTDDRVTRALSEVASHSEARGRRLLEALESGLASSGEQQMASARTLAATHSERSARLLLKEFGGTPQFRLLIARMGDVAVAPLAESIGQGNLQTVDCLGDIGTPKAAQALAEALWSEDASATAAAWRLAQLLRDPLVDSALAERALPESAKSHPYIDWIWAPFMGDDGRRASIKAIAGRSAYLIITNSSTPGSPYRLDPRIVMPLLLVYDPEFSLKLKIEYTRAEELGRILRALSVAQSDDVNWSNRLRRLGQSGQDNVIQSGDLATALDGVKIDSASSDKLGDLADEIISQARLSELEFYLLNSLPSEQKFCAVQRGLRGRCSVRQWEGVRDEVTYDKNRSWHKYVTQIMYGALILSATLSGLLLFAHNHAIGGRVLLGLALASIAAGLGNTIAVRSDFDMVWICASFSPLSAILWAKDMMAPLDMEDLSFICSFASTPSVILLISFALNEYVHLALWGIAIAWLIFAAIIISLIVRSNSVAARAENPLRGII
jgi:NACHT domain-containing protein